MVLPGESNSHYCVLGVGKNASEEEIRISYKKLAMKFHPDRHQANLSKDENCEFIDGVREDSTRMFQKVAEAYAVLSDPDRRAIYDASSRHSRARIARRNSTMLNTFTSNNYPNEHIPNDIEPWEIFRRVCCQQPFAKINQTANFSQPIIRKQSLRSSGKHQSKTNSYPYNECISSRSNAKRTSRKVMPPIEMEIEVKLEEFYYGCSKTAQVARKRFNEEWRVEDENFELEIEIQPGWKH
ncbi:dnaJ homolog subfamily B member 4-like [Convolutriloba macropyga]|uniref:dnaJ homolog subfamily B member 4-like n=1 Tax=Convolutriloba macropyga TaxID=536237 RepID=UPI003F521D23